MKIRCHAVTLAIVVAIVGCSLASCATSPRASTKTVRGADVSIAKAYASIRALRQASSVVIVGAATDRVHHVRADQAGKSGLHGVAREIRVVKVLRGQASARRTILVHQVFAPSATEPIDGLTLKSGEQYVMFLTPFSFGPGTPATGQYVLVGTQGLFHVEGRTAVHVGADSSGTTGVPAQLSVSTLTAQVASTK